MEAVTEALEIECQVCPPCRPATHARSHDAMRCAMRLRCERCHCDTKCGNGNLFPPCHRQPVDHPVPSSAVVPPVADGRWRANRERSGDRPRPWERVSTLLAIVSLALGCLSVPVPIFSDECASVLSSALLIDVAPTSWIRGGGARALTAREYVTLDRKNEQKPPVTSRRIK